MRKCVNCGNPANTIQHLLPKSVTDPEHYIRLAECEQCHNYGLDCSNAVSQRLMNNINTIPTTQVVTVNNLPVVARAGSLAPGERTLIPPDAFAANFLNKNTWKNNDFKIVREGSVIIPEGHNLGSEYMAYVFICRSGAY